MHKKARVSQRIQIHYIPLHLLSAMSSLSFGPVHALCMPGELKVESGMARQLDDEGSETGETSHACESSLTGTSGGRRGGRTSTGSTSASGGGVGNSLGMLVGFWMRERSELTDETLLEALEATDEAEASALEIAPEAEEAIDEAAPEAEEASEAPF